MEKTALETIKKYDMISEGDCIILGVSGGADSMSLLFFLCGLREKLGLKLAAVHINHGVRGKEADDDEKYVVDVCKELNVDITVKSIILKDEAKRLSMTEEEAGRKIRYDAFFDAAKKYNADKIAVAHNIDDNAETVLMRMFRGTGIKGLGGIAPKRGIIIRPLIECSRKIIEEYADKMGIMYRTDSTNTKEIYTRNKIRLRLMPWIRENFNQNISGVISRNSTIIRQENDYLDKTALKHLNEIIISKNRLGTELDCEKLKRLDEVILRRVIRLACVSFSADLHDISIGHIDDIASLIHKQSGKKISSIPNGIIAERQSGSIYIGYEREASPFSYRLDIDKEIFVNEAGMRFLLSGKKNDGFKNCFTIYTNYGKIKQGLTVRSRTAGDRIFIKGVGHKKVKDFFIDKKIPSAKRSRIPLVAYDKEVLCICGYLSADKEDENSYTFYIHFE